MDFGLSDDQGLFLDALRGWLTEQVPLPRVRTVMESREGYDPAILAGLGEQGVCGILVPEADGGMGLGLLDAALAAVELGRAATPISFHSACVAAPLAISMSANAEAKKRWLAQASEGKALLSFAPTAPTVAAGKLSGSALFVADVAHADAFVVVSGEGAQREALLVERSTPGLEVDVLSTVDDTRRVGELIFEDVTVTSAMRLDGLDPAAIDRVIDAARVVLAADAFGAAERALEESVRYGLTRKQFNRVIASFQGVKHICAEAYAELEPVRAFLWYAAFAWDQKNDESSRMIALVKAHASEAATAAVTTAVQVFGGMGFTWECDAHLWFKRVGYDRQMLGGPSWLRARGTSLSVGSRETE
jgi:alkylation response protein AidB-like acyl-CoA dehydrogenase